MSDRNLDHKTTLTIATCILVALTLLVAAFWGQAAMRGQKLAGFVETGAIWTRFDPPVLEQGKGPDSWKVPALFTYQVGASDFSGREMMYKSIFDAYKPQVGKAFRVWYDPQNPSDVVRSRRLFERDAGLLRGMTLITAGVAAVLGLLALHAHRAGGKGQGHGAV